MSNVPYGLTLMEGKPIVDEYQYKLVQLVHRLRLLKSTDGTYTVHINEQDIYGLLRNQKVPKVATEGYEIESHVEEILASANQLLKDKLEELHEESD